jgi:glycine/D-amino acid oxidase-like deaminating enzyme
VKEDRVKRLLALYRLCAELRWPDLRAAFSWIQTRHPDKPFVVRVVRFACWGFKQLWHALPDDLAWASFARPVSSTPIWLAQGNPFENHPFASNPKARLPDKAEVVVIGAGFTGAAVAYHWSKQANAPLVVLDMLDPACGASGRNEGLVVMGRYYHMVHGTVLRYLNRKRHDLTGEERDRLAHEFAAAYARAAYANAELIERTIAEEKINCDYVKKGWVQDFDRTDRSRLNESTRMAREKGFADWVGISGKQASQLSGMRLDGPAGYSKGAATWDPAQWVWGLFWIALRSPHVQLFTRTKVVRVEDRGETYAVHTPRGVIEARHVVSATESYTPQLFPHLHDVIQPTRTQAAFGAGDGGTMQPGVGISGPLGFFARHRKGVLFGGGATRVPDREAGGNRPSRFLTTFLLTPLKASFGVQQLQVQNEWSGTVGYTPDEFPVVGTMDGKRLYLIAGMAGSGSAVSFNAGRHVVCKILGVEGPDYYPERYFSPSRFRTTPGRLSRPGRSC